jgi:hypothetical protein
LGHLSERGGVVEGVDDGVGLLKEDSALGLQLAELGESALVGAFEVATVAGEAVEGSGLLGGAGGKWVRFVEEFGFAAGEAAEVPGGEEEAFEETLLDGAFGADVAAEAGLSSLEFELQFHGDDELSGGESVAAGVLGGYLLSFNGAGSGGMEGVGLIGGELGCGCHGVN